MMIFSCGHDNKDSPDFYGHNVSVAEYDRMHERCVSYKTVCERCLSMYKATGDLLHTEEQIEEWLKGDK
jgi:hypothetical protein